jgi:dipeptidyl aminopeptidase/acylaminoacyl peptidase
MHLTRRILPAALILVLAVATVTAGKSPFAIWDAGTVSGRDVLSLRVGKKKIRLRTRRTTEDATLLSASPDGRRVAWRLTPPGVFDRSDLVVAKAGKGRGRRVTKDLDGRVTDARWSRDSRWIVFTHEDRTTGRTDVWRANERGKKLENLTESFTGNIDTGPGTVFTVGETLAAVAWEFPTQRAVFLLDIRNEVFADRVTADLPDGVWTGTLHFATSGVFYFTWQPEGDDDPTLHRVTDTVVAEVVPGVVLVRPTADGVCVYDRTGVVSRVRDDRISRYDVAPDEVLSLHPSPGSHRVAALMDEPRRLYRLDVDHTWSIDMLAGRSIESVESVRYAGAFADVAVLMVREGGIRRLYRSSEVLGAATVTDLAEGLEGNVGAFLDVSSDSGLVLFTMIAEGSTRGGLWARSLIDGSVINLTELSGEPGTPGGAKFSKSTGNVLFNTVTIPDSDNRLFLWDRGEDRVIPVSDPGHRPGTFFFTK